MDRNGPPLLWISYEGIAAGLLMNPNTVEWKSEQLGNVNKSLKGFYWLLEIFWIKQQSYNGRDHNIRRWVEQINASSWESLLNIWCSFHLGKGRPIKPGQKVHTSVAFSKKYNPKKKYTPKAVFPEGPDSPKWDHLIRSDSVTEHVMLNYTSSWMGWLELDIFDVSVASTVVDNLEKSWIPPLISIYRLTMLTRSGELDIFSGPRRLLIECCPVLAEGCRAILRVPDAPQRVFRALSKVQSLGTRVHQYEIDIVDALVRFAPEYGIKWYVMGNRTIMLLTWHLFASLDEVESAETVIRLLRNPNLAFHECLRRFVPKFYQGG